MYLWFISGGRRLHTGQIQPDRTERTGAPLQAGPGYDIRLRTR